MLVDRFLDDAIEIDVDALCDGTEVYLGGVMEHIEEAGIHSGDSACVLPPITLGRSDIDTVRAHTEAIALGCGVRGLLNVQYALKGQHAVRARGEPAGVADGAVLLQGDRGAAGQGRGADHGRRHHRRSCGPRDCCPPTATARPSRTGRRWRSRRPCMPFHRFRRPDGTGVDTLLGPEMRSTGEVMGIDMAFGPAFAKSQTASYGSLPTSGTVFVSVANADKRSMVFPAKRLADLGFTVRGHPGYGRDVAAATGWTSRPSASTSRVPGQRGRRDPGRARSTW